MEARLYRPVFAIREGALYKARDGSHWRAIHKVHGSNEYERNYPWSMQMEDSQGAGAKMRVSTKGKYFTEKEHKLDLVQEIPE